MTNTIYDFSAKLINGKEIQLSEFKGKISLKVNTANKCGFTPQFDGFKNYTANIRLRLKTISKTFYKGI